MINGVWLTEVWNKNGAERKSWLLPVIRMALKTVLAKHDSGERVFQTEYGKRLVCEEGGRRDAVTGEFAKLGGFELPDDRRINGVNQTDLLRDSRSENETTSTFRALLCVRASGKI